jgi:hypothetical protein
MGTESLFPGDTMVAICHSSAKLFVGGATVDVVVE